MEVAELVSMFFELDNGLIHSQISDFGAKITQLIVPNKRGEKVDVVLGFASEEEWRTKELYFNAVIGRCANRIKGGRFTLDGKTYQLPLNNGTNSLHGGVHGFNEKTWDVIEHDATHIVLHYRAADGEEGYPGNLDVWVTYELTNDNALSIRYQAQTDAPTIVNFTNHAYFNLEGEQSSTVHNHILQVLADKYTPFDDTACPTGEILPVDGTPMDFRQPKRIGDRIHDPFFAPGLGIDNNWVLPASNELQKVASVSADGRTMEVWTTCPALQCYTANYVAKNLSKSGTMYGPQNAICLETHNCPDAINHPNFPSPILRPGETFTSQTEYRFI